MKFLLCLSLTITLLSAADSFSLAFLSKFTNESYPILRVGTYHFVCKPYGVVTINELLRREELSTSCKEELTIYQKRHPVDLKFSYRHLKIEQKYHYELIKEECILYSSGQSSYSEELLKNGLAIMRPLFSDDIWRYRHLKAQNFARIEKKGVWENNLINICITELYKD